MKRKLAILFLATAVAVPTFGLLMPVRDIESEDGGGWSGSASYSNGRYVDNPCTPTQDFVWVNYDAWVEGAQKAAGVDQWIFDESTTMYGTYAASGASLSDVGYAQPFELRQYHKVNTSDNFHVVTVINFDPASRQTTLTMETACGNGMPDSAQ